MWTRKCKKGLINVGFREFVHIKFLYTRSESKTKIIDLKFRPDKLLKDQSGKLQSDNRCALQLTLVRLLHCPYR